MQDSENNVNVGQEIQKNGQVYELGYLLLPTIKEDELIINYGNLKELLVSFGGEVVSDDMPKMISLSYPMSKILSNVRNTYTSAYFGWVKFGMDSGKILDLKKKLDLDPNLIRFLLIKTVRENTMASKRFVREGGYRKQKPKTSSKESVEPINKEEIDKEIEAMVSA